jgi:hypothetical protein
MQPKDGPAPGGEVEGLTWSAAFPRPRDEAELVGTAERVLAFPTAALDFHPIQLVHRVPNGTRYLLDFAPTEPCNF